MGGILLRAVIVAPGPVIAESVDQWWSNGESSSWEQRSSYSRMKVRTAQRIQSTEEAHNVRWIHRARLSAHRIRTGTTEAHIRDAATVRSESAASPAPTALVGGHLRPAFSSIQSANPGQAITGHPELVAIWPSRGSRQRANAGQNTGQRSGIPDATTHRRTRGARQATPDLCHRTGPRQF